MHGPDGDDVRIKDGKQVGLKFTDEDLSNIEVIQKKFCHASRCAAIRHALRLAAETARSK